MTESMIPDFYKWWEQHYSMANLAMGAAEDAWNAGAKAERERIAAEIQGMADAHRERCNRSFDAGDQGSAILERVASDTYNEMVDALLSDTEERG
jgi:hypothetical protein